jgi:multiple sugar transport system substrate-binding protein
MKAAAWKAIEYFSRPDTQRRFHELTGNLPPRRASWAGALDGDLHARAFREQLERVKPAPKVPEWERIAQEMRLVTERVVLGDLPAAAEPAELDLRVDRMLEKRRWMLARGTS